MNLERGNLQSQRPPHRAVDVKAQASVTPYHVCQIKTRNSLRNAIRLVAKLFEHRAKSRALIGKCTRKNATPSEGNNVRGALGAARIFAF